MKPPLDSGQIAQLPDVMNKLLMGLAVVCILLMTPFAVNNFIQGRAVIGFGAVLIISIFLITAWGIYRHKRHYPNLILFGLIPAILFFLLFALRHQGLVGVFWSYPAVISFYFMLPERKAWLANLALLAIALPYVWYSFDPALAARIIVTLVMVSIFAALFINVITDQQRRLQRQAVTDPLTGALNRATLPDTLRQAARQHSRSALPMTLVALDLDHFKHINDELGHDAGDSVLKAVAKLLRERCRSVDKVFRLGGEEFLVFLYNTDLANAARVAEELRARIATLPTLPDRAITVSAGVAALQPDEHWRAWVKRGDENLYRAKSGGRNRVVA